MIADAQAAYERREQEFGSEVMREVERRVILSVLDRKWREHLYEMDYLREGIGLRGYGQRDPLIEYQREGYDMFSAMMEGIKEESVGLLFNLEVQVQENPIVEEERETPGPCCPAAPLPLPFPRSAVLPVAAPRRRLRRARPARPWPPAPRRPACPRWGARAGWSARAGRGARAGGVARAGRGARAGPPRRGARPRQRPSRGR